MIVVQELPFNMVHFILGGIFSMLFCNFKAQEIRHIHSPPKTEFSQSDTDTNIHPFHGSSAL